MSDADNTQIEVKAREIGWRPQAEFKGDPEKWVAADEYLRRGEEVLPLVKAENRRLHEKTDKLSAEIARLTGALGEQQKSMGEFREFAAAQLKERLIDQKRQIAAQLREARKDENDTLIETLEEQLEENAEARQALAKAPAPAPAAPAAPQQVVETPEYKEWIGNNPWFGGSSKVDQAKTAAAQSFGLQAAKEGKTGRAFFEAVNSAMEEAYPQQRAPDKTEDGRPQSGGGSGSTGSPDKGFNALPAEAKAKAREQASRFVGANKMFKTEAEWHKYYAEQYNQG